MILIIIIITIIIIIKNWTLTKTVCTEDLSTYVFSTFALIEVIFVLKNLNIVLYYWPAFAWIKLNITSYYWLAPV